MKTIHKYPLQVTDVQNVSLPAGAVIRALQTQYNMPQLWAEVDTEVKETETRTFFTAGTGHPLPCDKHEPVFVGTYQLQGGVLIYHVYEVKP